MDKSTYEKCINSDMVIWEKLSQDVKDILAYNKKLTIQFYSEAGNWRTKNGQMFGAGTVYRIDPSTKIDGDFEESSIYINVMHGKYMVQGSAGNCYLHEVISETNFCGVIYELDVKEYLQTSLNTAFGTPKRIRFKK